MKGNRKLLVISLVVLVLAFISLSQQVNAATPTYAYLVKKTDTVYQTMDVGGKKVQSVEVGDMVLAQPVSNAWYYVVQKKGYVQSKQLQRQMGDFYVVSSNSNIGIYANLTASSKRLVSAYGKSVVIKYGQPVAGWVFVKYCDTFGYMANSALKKANVKSMQIEQSAGSGIRMYPTRSAKVIATIPSKANVKVYSELAGWSFVSSDYGNGYILTRDLIKQKSVPKTNKKIALTFDDGPNTRVTPQILKTLKQYNTKATFFVLGQEVERNPKLAKQIVTEGHQIANHSWNHRDLARLSIQNVQTDLLKTNQMIQRVTGVAPKVYRPPYGSMNNAMRNKINMRPILWSVDTLDWKHRNLTQTVNYVKNGARPGGIILMHDIHQTTANALENVIVYLRSQGYTLVTVDQL